MKGQNQEYESLMVRCIFFHYTRLTFQKFKNSSSMKKNPSCIKTEKLEARFPLRRSTNFISQNVTINTVKQIIKGKIIKHDMLNI